MSTSEGVYGGTEEVRSEKLGNKGFFAEFAEK
jgi:hypothetical protein